MHSPPLAALLLTALAPVARAQFPTPSAAEQQSILERVRAAALAFSDQLQDFLCLQHTVRSADDSGKDHWKRLDTQELELTYFARKEHYKVLTIDGKPVGTGKRVKAGYFTPGGEFGAPFRGVFDPKVKAQFEWDHGEVANGRRLCVFRYRVPVETTAWVMTANLDTVRLSHHGFVEADCDSGAILRIHMETDPATTNQHGHMLAIGDSLEVRYGPVTIGSQEFLAPLEAEEIVPFGPRRTRVQMRFEQYRKYDSSSSITFGDPK